MLLGHCTEGATHPQKQAQFSEEGTCCLHPRDVWHSQHPFLLVLGRSTLRNSIIL